MQEDVHLWKVDHPYYCNECGYGCHYELDSWADFMSEMGDSDPEYNLCFRWDWILEEEKLENEECPQIISNKLKLFFMLQHKGILISYDVKVKKEDEPLIRKWLEERMVHLLKLWEPLIDIKDKEIK